MKDGESNTNTNGVILFGFFIVNLRRVLDLNLVIWDFRSGGSGRQGLDVCVCFLWCHHNR